MVIMEWVLQAGTARLYSLSWKLAADGVPSSFYSRHHIDSSIILVTINSNSTMTKS
jgi:hypothetical protein